MNEFLIRNTLILMITLQMWYHKVYWVISRDIYISA